MLIPSEKTDMIDTFHFNFGSDDELFNLKNCFTIHKDSISYPAKSSLPKYDFMFNQYGDYVDSAVYVEVVIEDNFVKSLSYGDSFESLLTYNMTQGEYTEYTGDVFVITEN
jgi:hypothetical protein